MRILIFIIGAAFLLSGCAGSGGSSTVRLEGRIDRPLVQNVSLSGDGVLEKAHLEEGRFEFDVAVPGPGYYTLWHDRLRTTLYLVPGAELRLAADGGAWEESLQFEGDLAAENGFLQEQLLRREQLFRESGSYQELTRLPEAPFRQKLETLYGALEEALKDFQYSGKETDPEFVALENMELQLEKATRLLNYPPAHNYFTEGAAYKPTPGFYRFTEEIDLNDARVLKLRSFDDFVTAWMDAEARSNEVSEKTVNDWLAFRLDLFDQSVDNEKVRNYLLLALTAKALEKDGIHLQPELVARARQSISQEQMVQELDRLYGKWSHLSSGQPAPGFSYPSADGEVVSLEDLRGRYLFVDVWATWCGPCLRELPFLEALQQRFDGDDRIAFVSISIDENRQAWRRFLREKQPEGLHLLAEKGWNAAICLDYQISALPRFILIGPEGNLLDADAPRPSSGMVEGLIEKALEEGAPEGRGAIVK